MLLTPLNPPYGRTLAAWVTKGHEEAESGHAKTVVALLPARPDTKYWHEHMAARVAVYFLRGLLRFGNGKQSAPFPSALAIWGADAETLAALDAALVDAWRTDDGSRRVFRGVPPQPIYSARQRPLSGANSRAGGISTLADAKTEIVVYDGTETAELIRPDGPVTARNAPAIVKAAGKSAEFAWEEFFQAEIANPHTRKNYMHAVRQFLAWAEARGLELARVAPGDVGEYLQGLELAIPTKKLHLAALRRFFDRLVNRHACVINPAATVKAERYAIVEGRTPEIGIEQARTLVKSIDISNPVGLRDRAVLAVLVYTAARVRAVAKLTVKNFVHDGSQYTLRFSEKGGKSREIPVRHDLEQLLLAYVRAAGIADGRLFRTANRKTKTLTSNAMTGIDICRMISGGAARALLAALLPGGDGDRFVGSERPARRCPVPGRARRPADHPDLRPAAAEGHAKHRRANFYLIKTRS